jgi:hypothetical protein
MKRNSVAFIALAIAIACQVSYADPGTDSKTEVKSIQSAATGIARSRLWFCEGMLAQGMKSHSTGASILASIRDLGWKIGQRVPKGTPLVTEIPQVMGIRSTFEGLPLKSAQRALARIQGIDKSITETDLDQRIVAWEFRGHDQVVNAASELYQKLSSLESAYEGIDAQLTAENPAFVVKKRSLHRQFLASLVVFNAMPMLGLATHHVGLMMASFFLTVPFNLASYAVWRSTKIGSREIYQSHFQSALRDLIAKKNDDQFAMFSQFSIFPTEFDKAIFTGEGDFVHARTEAAQLLSGPLSMMAYFSTAKEDYQKNLVANAGDFARKVTTDHILYFDKETQEPVWLFIYRSARFNPMGKKPRKPVEEAQEQDYFEPGLAPGKIWYRSITLGDPPWATCRSDTLRGPSEQG